MMLSSQKCMCSKMLSSRNEPPEYFRKIVFHKSFPKHALFSDRKLALYVGASISWSFRKCQKCQVHNLRHTVNVCICVYICLFSYLFIYIKWWFQDFSKEMKQKNHLSFCRIGSVWSSCCWGNLGAFAMPWSQLWLLGMLPTAAFAAAAQRLGPDTGYAKAQCLDGSDLAKGPTLWLCQNSYWKWP